MQVPAETPADPTEHPGQEARARGLPLPNRQLVYLGQLALLAAAYFITARLALLFAIPPGYATAVWPPSGIALAAML
ncbi:MAG TPA: hypothetical protein VFG44_05000, partial [Burkholderiales bacterium]|nr:hypothetical protein [Burkholderiales bacterium]